MISQTNVPIMKKAVNVIYDMSEDTRIERSPDFVKKLCIMKCLHLKRQEKRAEPRELLR